MKNNHSELVTTVVKGVLTLWKGYKRTALRRHSDPMTSFWNDLFGLELNDVDAAKFLAKDVSDIREQLRTKKTDKEFDKIIKKSY